MGGLLQHNQRLNMENHVENEATQRAKVGGFRGIKELRNARDYPNADSSGPQTQR